MEYDDDDELMEFFCTWLPWPSKFKWKSSQLISALFHQHYFTLPSQLDSTQLHQQNYTYSTVTQLSLTNFFLLIFLLLGKYLMIMFHWSPIVKVVYLSNPSFA